MTASMSDEIGILASGLSNHAAIETCHNLQEQFAKAAAALERLAKNNDDLMDALHGAAIDNKDQGKQIAELQAENEALLRQWNELDQRNEKRHREWTEQLTAAAERAERAQAERDQLKRDLKWQQVLRIRAENELGKAITMLQQVRAFHDAETTDWLTVDWAAIGELLDGIAPAKETDANQLAGVLRELEAIQEHQQPSNGDRTEEYIRQCRGGQPDAGTEVKVTHHGSMTILDNGDRYCTVEKSPCYEGLQFLFRKPFPESTCEFHETREAAIEAATNWLKEKANKE